MLNHKLHPLPQKQLRFFCHHTEQVEIFAIYSFHKILDMMKDPLREEDLSFAREEGEQDQK